MGRKSPNISRKCATRPWKNHVRVNRSVNHMNVNALLQCRKMSLRDAARANGRLCLGKCNGNVTGRQGLSPIYQRSWIGTNLRELSRCGQKPAEISRGNNTVFAGDIVACTVSGPCGSTLPAPHMHLLFRTPSLRGQACVPHKNLSAFFFLRATRAKRGKNLHKSCLCAHLILNNRPRFAHLSPQRNQETKKGRSSCESLRTHLCCGGLRRLGGLR